MPKHSSAWERRRFTIATVVPHAGLVGEAEVDGIVMEDVELGLHMVYPGSIDVTHLPSKKRIGSFSSLGAAMEFVSRIAYLLTWNTKEPVFSPDALKTIQDLRIALESTAARPRQLSEMPL